MNDKEFLIKYENLLNKGYCDCNEMNCIDNNSPRRILNIAVKQQKEIERLNNIINDMEKEIDRLLERQYESEKFAKEQGFDTYLPAKENLLWVKNKLKELKRRNK